VLVSSPYFRVSQRGVDLIKKFESFEPEAYPDTGGVPTVGWGFTYIYGRPVTLEDTVTLDEANTILDENISAIEKTLNKYVKVQLNQNQIDSLISFVYNIGSGEFSRSTLLALLNRGEYDKIPEQIKRWHFDNGVSINGLVNRRELEAKIFMEI